MKKTVVIILIIIIIAIGAIAIPLYISSRNSYKTEDDGKDVVLADSIKDSYEGDIIYSRFGLQKGIYCISMENGKKHCIAKGKLENAVLSKGVLAFIELDLKSGEKNLKCTSLNDESTINIYNCKADQIEKAAINPEGTLVVYKKRVEDENKKIEYDLYSVSIDSMQETPLGIDARSVVDVSFIGSSSIIYTKLITKDENSTYQVFTYSFTDKKEKRIHTSDSNDIDPVASPDGKYIAYLSIVGTRYSPCIMTADGENFGEDSGEDDGEDGAINKDVVLGGTLRWSPNSRYLLYTSVSYSSPDVYTVKVVDTASHCQSKAIGSGYIGGFSPDSRAVVFASYVQDGNSKQQTISISDIEEKNSWEIISMTEAYGCYAKSINMLEWVNNIKKSKKIE